MLSRLFSTQSWGSESEIDEQDDVHCADDELYDISGTRDYIKFIFERKYIVGLKKKLTSITTSFKICIYR